jgi:chromosome partitioning protein
VIFKGGAAKSTTVIHLAQRCAIDGLRVLLLDLDAQATTTNLHGLHPSIDVLEEDTLTDALIENPGAIVSRIRPTHIDGLDLIAGNLYLQNADLILPNAKANNQDTLGLNPIERLDAALRTVEDQYDLILFDCGPNLGSLVLNAVVAADGLLVTIPPMMNDFASSALFFENMNSLYAHSGIRRQLEFVKILITRHTETKEAKDAEALIRVSYGDAVLGPYMVDSVEVERAFNQMGTVYEVQRPRGSPDAYKRALEALDATNLAAIEVFKRTWQRQADAAAAAAGAAVTAEA